MYSEIFVLLYGRWSTALVERKRRLEQYGYRVVTANHFTDLMHVPVKPRMQLLVLSEFLSHNEAFAASTHAEARWPGIKKLVLEQLPPDMRAPTHITSLVTKTVGVSTSTAYSHVY